MKSNCYNPQLTLFLVYLLVKTSCPLLKTLIKLVIWLVIVLCNNCQFFPRQQNPLFTLCWGYVVVLLNPVCVYWHRNTTVTKWYAGSMSWCKQLKGFMQKGCVSVFGLIYTFCRIELTFGRLVLTWKASLRTFLGQFVLCSPEIICAKKLSFPLETFRWTKKNLLFS